MHAQLFFKEKIVVFGISNPENKNVYICIFEVPGVLKLVCDTFVLDIVY